MVRQIIGSVCSCETTEQMITSVAATVGGSAKSQMPSAVSAVPKPVSPLTMPPARAPMRIRTI